MAGVIINLSGSEPRERYCTHGAYSYRQRRPAAGARGWGQYEKPIADYLALGDGDLVFFFENRRIYGTGRIARLPGAGRATLCNYPCSWDLSADPAPLFLWDNEPEADLADHPFVVFFTPDPAWYAQGIDMDEALASDAHGYVRSLPFFSGVSFARIDAFEAAHLASLIRKANTAGGSYPDNHGPVHLRASGLVSDRPQMFNIDVDALVRQYSEDGLLRHEALLEAWLIDAFRNRWELLRSVIGRPQPTFVGRQVPASPFKPPEYIDRIDLLAYDIEAPTPSSPIPVAHSYLVAELKRAEANSDDIKQALKYVDWMAHTQQGGDYSGITAMVISAGYPAEVRETAATEGQRNYVRPRRPYDTDTWAALQLVQYRVTSSGPAIELSLLNA